MNKELRRVSIVVLIMFLALFGSSTIIQVFQQDNLKSDSRNSRQYYASFNTQRGAILVDGQPIAQSVASNDVYKYQRVYANGPLYSAVTGYSIINGAPTGIEGAENQDLSGNSGDQFFDRINAIVTGQEPQGASVSLTIDPKVQQAAYDALGDYQGAVVALDPKTGAILAMVSKPDYDPNQLASHDTKQAAATYKQLLADPGNPLVNRAINGSLDPPGSTFKLVVASAAFANGYTPDSAFPNPSRLQLTGTNTFITNSEGGDCGGGATATIKVALQYSCNIPFAQLGGELGYDKVSAQAKAYGFGDDSLRIPMKVTPSVYPQTTDAARQELSSFGQADDRASPLQMAMVSAAIANGGELMRPNLVQSITNSNLSTKQSFSPQSYGQPVSSDIASTLTQLMVNNVDNGAASNARISGVQVAGKTGTAQNGARNQLPYTLWFTGFAPADNPQVAVAVVVQNGGGIGHAGFGNTLAAPIAKKVIEAVLSR
ncbi:peptidoglycan D,D-transpeptidase FtsI family protein [Pseudolysinimonas sp.]|uniref:peptidoglycan D,D-transpeptidase FtsI family protein n=1 Tax=Pseudolysinimonas sp. TaxID=2680009 RepID=UPI003F7E2FB6